MQTKGRIIVLNGTSSAGKTSLAKALMAQAGDAYCYLSLDEFRQQIQQAYLRMFPFLENMSAETINIGLGIVAAPQITLLHTTIKALSAMGHQVIVDHVLFSKALQEECKRILEGCPVIWVGVYCPLHELERREKERGDRKIGLAKSQYEIVHESVEYDCQVSTYEMDPQQCAEHVMAYIKTIG